ncbi:hypothetical protein Anapl_07975 [Anas platyrhynchos]|uniref:Uncharacterized protein n=1 Tax=Anas platyrhynchos TaxID=8839 RepID=R0JL59_ANAPL|nr:hypothetical protein Anapl_07975 [Anas platyrhynchos]
MWEGNAAQKLLQKGCSWIALTSTALQTKGKEKPMPVVNTDWIPCHKSCPLEEDILRFPRSDYPGGLCCQGKELLALGLHGSGKVDRSCVITDDYWNSASASEIQTGCYESKIEYEMTADKCETDYLDFINGYRAVRVAHSLAYHEFCCGREPGRNGGCTAPFELNGNAACFRTPAAGPPFTELLGALTASWCGRKKTRSSKMSGRPPWCEGTAMQSREAPRRKAPNKKCHGQRNSACGTTDTSAQGPLAHSLQTFISISTGATAIGGTGHPLGHTAMGGLGLTMGQRQERQAGSQVLLLISLYCSCPKCRRTDLAALAIVAGVTLTAFGHFRIWLHNQRDPSLVSCIDFMLVLYSQSPPAKEVLLHCIGCHRALVGRCVSPGMSKDYNEERALLGGACLGKQFSRVPLDVQLASISASYGITLDLIIPAALVLSKQPSSDYIHLIQLHC